MNSLASGFHLSLWRTFLRLCSKSLDVQYLAPWYLLPPCGMLCSSFKPTYCLYLFSKRPVPQGEAFLHPLDQITYILLFSFSSCQIYNPLAKSLNDLLNTFLGQYSKTSYPKMSWAFEVVAFHSRHILMCLFKFNLDTNTRS